MRIALFTDGIFPYVVGGMQRHSFYLAKYLSAQGHHVDLYHCGPDVKKLSDPDVFTEEEKKNISFYPVVFPSFGKAPGHYIKESYEYSRRIFSEFSKHAAVDFIIAKGFTAWELLHQRTKGFSCAPVGVNFHGYEMFQKAPSFVESLKYRLLLRSPVLFNVKHADYLFSYGGGITDIIMSLINDRKKIIEIPAGIDPSWLSDVVSGSSTFTRFVFVGRYERRKGLPELSGAIRLLGSESKFSISFIGDIPVAKQLKDERVKYLGPITDAEKMRSVLKESDVLLCPSISEGMPNVILESMACGLAVIASDVGAVRVMVNERNGWLVSPGSVQQLADAMKTAIGMPPAQLKSKKEDALATVKEQFAWPLIVNQLEKKLEQLIAGTG